MNLLDLVFLLILPGMSSGQTGDSLLLPVGPRHDVVAACAEAMGGWEAIDGLRNLTFDHALRGGGPPIRWEIVWPSLFRQEREDQFVFLFDGSRAGFIYGPKRGDDPLPEPHLLAEEDWGKIEMDLAQYFPAFFFFPWEDLGPASLGETQVHQVKVVFPLGQVAVYSLDAEEFLPLRVDFPELEYGVTLGDLRRVHGVLLPHRFNPVNDPERVTIIENVRANVELDRARFTFPPGIGEVAPGAADIR